MSGDGTGEPRIHLVTGAGSGIGSAVAQRLLARGDELWLLARDAGRARALADRYPGAKTLVGDLAEPSRLSWALGHQAPPDRLDSLLHIAAARSNSAGSATSPRRSGRRHWPSISSARPS